MDDQIPMKEKNERGLPIAYEPPRIELVLTPEQIEREAHYAGGPTPPAVL